MADRQLDPVVRKAVDMITAHGVMIMLIGGGPGTAPFAYTAGLTPHDHPELILLGGVRPEYARVVLTGLAMRVLHTGTRFRAGVRLGDVLDGYDVVFAGPASPDYDDLYPLNIARAIYGPRAGHPLQVVYPDRDGRFPWDDGYSMAGQPLICPVPPLDKEES